MSYAVVCIALLLNAADPDPALPEPDMDAEQAVASRDIERAARDYRILVYQTYRTDREKYDAHRLPADDLLLAWQHAGHPAAYREDILNWYQEASEQINDAEASLPEFPELPDRLPEFANDPTAAPHFPSQDRLHVPVSNAGDPTRLDQSDDVFGTTGAPDETYNGPKYVPASKLFQSIQRALISSTGAEPSSEAESDAPNTEIPLPSDGGADSFFNSDSPFDLAPRKNSDSTAAPQLNNPRNP